MENENETEEDNWLPSAEEIKARMKTAFGFDFNFDLGI